MKLYRFFEHKVLYSTVSYSMETMGIFAAKLRFNTFALHLELSLRFFLSFG